MPLPQSVGITAPLLLSSGGALELLSVEGSIAVVPLVSTEVSAELVSTDVQPSTHVVSPIDVSGLVVVASVGSTVGSVPVVAAVVSAEVSVPDAVPAGSEQAAASTSAEIQSQRTME